MLENYLNSNIIFNFNNNTNSNSAFTTFSTKHNLKLEKSQIKVNKSNKIMNSSNANYSSSISKGVLGNLKSKNKNIKNNGKLILNEESIDRIKNKSMFPSFHFVKNIQNEKKETYFYF